MDQNECVDTAASGFGFHWKIANATDGGIAVEIPNDASLNYIAETRAQEADAARRARTEHGDKIVLGVLGFVVGFFILAVVGVPLARKLIAHLLWLRASFALRCIACGGTMRYRTMVAMSNGYAFRGRRMLDNERRDYECPNARCPADFTALYILSPAFISGMRARIEMGRLLEQAEEAIAAEDPKSASGKPS